MWSKRTLLSRLFILLSATVLGQPADTLTDPGLNGKAHGVILEHYKNASNFKVIKDFKGAIEEYTSAIAAKPDYFKSYMNRADVKFLIYDFDGALLDYDKSVELIQNSIDDHSKKGEIKRILNQRESAIGEFQQSFKLKTSLAEAYFRRGNVKQFTGDKSGGCTDLTTAMEMGNPKAEATLKDRCGYVAPVRKKSVKPIAKPPSTKEKPVK